MALNDKQKRFADEYIIHLNAAQAAVQAGYGIANAANQGYRLLQDPEVAWYIQTRQRELQTRLNVTQERVIEEVAKLAFSNMRDFVSVNADGDPVPNFSTLTRDQWASVQEVTVDSYVDGKGPNAKPVKKVKLKLHDKRGPLNDLCKHLGLFDDKSVGIGGQMVSVMIETGNLDELSDGQLRAIVQYHRQQKLDGPDATQISFPEANPAMRLPRQIK